MNFKRTYLSLEETKRFPKTLTDYIKGEPWLTPFYEYKPVITDFKKAILNRAALPVNRDILVKRLKERYKTNAPGATELTLKNIELLGADNCFTVTTGHQICLFTGPLYFIYKIITAINLAKKLEETYPDNHFVPVYWMATEDHDFAEINHAYLFGKKVEWIPEPEPKGPVGNISTDSLKPVIEEINSIMGEASKSSGLAQLFTDAYLNHKTLSEATFYLVDKLFGMYGLVVVDPNDAQLKKEFLPVITDELLNQNSARIVNTTNKKLQSAGIEPQVHEREINLFYVDENGRNRLEKKGKDYQVVNTNKSFSQEQIIAEANKFPERFSPNVVLRPLYQQMILPNIAYVGGPSEVAYWLQLKDIFNHYNAAFPVIVPRCFALLIDRSSAEKMKKLGLSIADLLRDTEEIVKEFVVRNSSGNIGFEGEKKSLQATYDSISKRTRETDLTLVSIVEAELQKQFNALKGLETKLIRAQKQKLETSVAQIRKLKEKLFPGGGLQERYDNFIPFYIAWYPSYIEELTKNLVALDYKLTVLEEE